MNEAGVQVQRVWHMCTDAAWLCFCARPHLAPADDPTRCSQWLAQRETRDQRGKYVMALNASYLGQPYNGEVALHFAVIKQV